MINNIQFTISVGCARFPETLQTFSECQISWSLCLAVFLAFTLRLPIQTSNICTFRGKNVKISAKRAHPRVFFQGKFIVFFIKYYYETINCTLTFLALINNNPMCPFLHCSSNALLLIITIGNRN